MVKKPTGTLGPNKVTVQPDGIIAHSFEKIAFPKEKNAVEEVIVSNFISSMNDLMSQSRMKWFMSEPIQNSENDFDFTITLPNGSKAWLELMEIAPLELFGGYDKVPGKYKPYDLAKIITSMIMKKAVRYSGSIGKELHLLTYITHWAFTPSESLINLLRVFIAQERHPFAGVYLYSPLELGVGTGKVLALGDANLHAGFNPEEYKDNTVINLDPTKFQLVQGSVDSSPAKPMLLVVDGEQKNVHERNVSLSCESDHRTTKIKGL